MDETPGAVIWRMRRSPHYVTCVVEQVGEECFELRIFDGHDPIHTERFERTDLLLARAEELRRMYARSADDKTAVREHELVRS